MLCYLLQTTFTVVCFIYLSYVALGIKLTNTTNRCPIIYFLNIQRIYLFYRIFTVKCDYERLVFISHTWVTIIPPPPTHFLPAIIPRSSAVSVYLSCRKARFSSVPSSTVFVLVPSQRWDLRKNNFLSATSTAFTLSAHLTQHSLSCSHVDSSVKIWWDCHVRNAIHT